MKNRLILLMAICATLALALAPTACNKVRDPEVSDQPKLSDKASTDAKAPTGPAPQITCDKPEHDFGTISQGGQAEHVFTVRNTGKGVLKIERARGG